MRDKRVDIGYKNFKKSTENFINELVEKRRVEIEDKGKVLKSKQLVSR